MRLPRESILFLGLATAFCLLGSVVFGIATGRIFTPNTPRASATPPPTALSTAVPLTATPAMPASPGVAATQAPLGEQKSLLLICVDDAQAAAPQLESVWVLTFQPGDDKYYLLAVPPTAEFYVASLSGSMSMRDIFREDLYQQVGHTFVRDAIAWRFPGFPIDADVVLDRGDFAGLVTSVGGLTWAGQLVAGEDLLKAYDSFGPDDNPSRMLFQKQVFETLYAALAARGMAPTALLDYIRQVPQVQADAARLAALDAFVADAPALSTASLIWTTYQPQMEIGSTP